MGVTISRSILAGMKKASAAAAPLEACGLLLGARGVVEQFTECANVSDMPEIRFEIDPTALFAALRDERAGGPLVLGYWHSHPSGDATPSRTDAAMAAPDGKLWVILGGDSVTCWRTHETGLWDRFESEALLIV
ncbi:Mov34/MPN/PAD-1 family protein [Sphingomonas sp. TDK1]|uniref:Mov34/MPN/PAD-1 family protein n=1 Tax=Sphingomonas sp. TDK1 TaxID=453247 RepID=UPI0007D989D5|nr:M67 family metallopeptidase [Sphingomonas sp. TDK1]OAN57381.1 peptidase [Sphingomonas sp. TDK1]